MEMKIKIDIGTRGTLKEFKKSYQPEFLSKYGYKPGYLQDQSTTAATNLFFIKFMDTHSKEDKHD